MARACYLRKGDLGAAVASREPGQGGFALHDPKGGTVQPRTQYVSGFRDGCPRQFTAVLAIFGDATTHRAQRFSVASKGLAFTAVDRAYEVIRASVCRAPVGSKCPESRAAKLERSLTFVSLYEGFGRASQWGDVLRYNGQVIAVAKRSR